MVRDAIILQGVQIKEGNFSEGSLAGKN